MNIPTHNEKILLVKGSQDINNQESMVSHNALCCEITRTTNICLATLPNLKTCSLFPLVHRELARI